MAAFEISLVPCLQDNFAVILQDHETRHCAVIDVPDAAPIIAKLNEKGWTPNIVLLTHKHADHTQGVPALKQAFQGLEVFGPSEMSAIELDHVVKAGEVISIGNLKAKVVATPGHTLGHVAYHFETEDLVFTGDTLFVMGCGRVFEGTMADLHSSLQSLASLPRQTRIYCGHDYTLNNARFAASVLPDHEAINERLETVKALHDMGKHSVPSTVQMELQTNIFLMCDQEDVKAALDMAGTTPLEVFTRLREMKNQF